MPPSRSKGRERQCGHSQPGTSARRSSNSSRRTSSLESSPPRRSGESTPQRKRAARASSTKGGSGSKTTSTRGTLPSCDNTLKTPLNQLEDLGSKEALYPGLIPLSRNYFDALSGMEQDAPLVERNVQTRHKENQRTSAPSKDPNSKAPMRPEQLMEEAEEEELHLALHLSRMEAHRTHRVGSGSGKASTSGGEKEAAGQSKSWIARRTIRLADGLKTLPPQPPPLEPQKSSRTRSRAAAALPPHLAKITAATRKNLPRSLVPCRLVPLKPQREESAPQDLLEAPGETPTEAGASRTSNTRTIPTTTTRTPEESPRTQTISTERQDT